MDTSAYSSTSSGALSRIPQLSNVNYRQWSFAMKFLLVSDDLWEYVQPPTSAEYAEIVVGTPETNYVNPFIICPKAESQFPTSYQ